VITVHGVLGEPGQGLRDAVADADRVVGGQRHLNALCVPEERRITLGALRVAVDRIAALPADADVVVLASGDPLYFGVVRALRARGLQPTVVTAPTSIAAAFAAVGLPWDDAVVVSVHGRPLAPAVNLARAFPKVAVLTSAEHGVRELAAALGELRRWFVLAERLGEPDQRVVLLDADQALAAEPAEPNVVLVLAAPPDELHPFWNGTLAGPERAARPEVCAAAAVAFVRLLPEPGDLLLVSGPLADEVAALAAWSGAALARPAALPSAPGPDDATVSTPGRAQPTPELGAAISPDLVLTDSLGHLTGSPRAVVFTGEPPDGLPAGYHWLSEQVGDHHLTTGVRE
jgi:precorrin-6y C5,15-methyltransferase (decarboxylating) CbiE subunit